jgi:hypothetical protein
MSKVDGVAVTVESAGYEGTQRSTSEATAGLAGDGSQPAESVATEERLSQRGSEWRMAMG